MSCTTGYSQLDAKDPGDFLNPVTIDFSRLVPSGATLTGTPAVTASPAGLTIGSAWTSGALLQFQVSGGTSGVTYTYDITVTDTSGNTWHRQVQQIVQAGIG